ncbi:DUF433 domain-containing protein [Neolewinella sp.]|uniref:DUF433 domain-containing protein n=1 Tax=Neolewinella sp. TaxID=2993543 RepID=UPI003B51F26F
MRYMVTAMLDYLAGGDTIDELMEEFEELEREDLLACIAYANTMLRVRDNSASFALI